MQPADQSRVIGLTVRTTGKDDCRQQCQDEPNVPTLRSPLSRPGGCGNQRGISVPWINVPESAKLKSSSCEVSEQQAVIMKSDCSVAHRNINLMQASLGIRCNKYTKLEVHRRTVGKI